ncbi:MAG: exonuclease domain-containing protein [Bacteroidota bacterium]|jgi:DNA polymerase III epsilon subunit family exonuclease
MADWQSRHIDETDFLVVDVETTGLSPDTGDRVCEIGAIKIRGGAVVDTLSSLVNPCRPISAGAYAVNRISPAMVADAPEFHQLAERLLQMMDDSVLVAYNAPFDVSFLDSELRLAGHPRIRAKVVDALAIARQLLPGIGRYPQENVAQFLGIPFPVKHRALDDVMVTSRIFIFFVSMMKAYDLTSVADLGRRDLSSVMQTKRISIVQEAMIKGSHLWIKYLSPTNAEITDRIVTPKDLVTEQTPYLFAYCHSAKAERNFRIDRILDLRLVQKVSA